MRGSRVLLGGSIAAVLGLVTVHAHAALSGAERANFLALWGRVCFRLGHGDPRFAGVPARSISTICACAGRRLADRLDFDQLYVRSDPATGRPRMDPQMAADLGRDAYEYCLARHGGYIPGMSVTPNR